MVPDLQEVVNNEWIPLYRRCNHKNTKKIPERTGRLDFL